MNKLNIEYSTKKILVYKNSFHLNGINKQIEVLNKKEQSEIEKLNTQNFGKIRYFQEMTKIKVKYVKLKNQLKHNLYLYKLSN